MTESKGSSTVSPCHIGSAFGNGWEEGPPCDCPPPLFTANAASFLLSARENPRRAVAVGRWTRPSLLRQEKTGGALLDGVLAQMPHAVRLFEPERRPWKTLIALIESLNLTQWGIIEHRGRRCWPAANVIGWMGRRPSSSPTTRTRSVPSWANSAAIEATSARTRTASTAAKVAATDTPGQRQGSGCAAHARHGTGPAERRRALQDAGERWDLAGGGSGPFAPPRAGSPPCPRPQRRPRPPSGC
jgi:hypothetical protein